MIQENQKYHFQGETEYTFKVISVAKEKVAIISEDQIFSTTKSELISNIKLGLLRLV